MLKVKSFITEDGRHTPFFISGLLELEKKGEIELSFSPLALPINNRTVFSEGTIESGIAGYPWCSELLVEHDGVSKRIGIDLQDWTNYFSQHALEHCDVIYKRALVPNSEGNLSKALNCKIKAFGPNHAVRIEDPRYNSLVSAVNKQQKLKKALAEPIRAINKLFKSSKKQANAAQTSSLQAIPKTPYIFFQVQCHDWGDNPNSKGLNEFRADLIRKLRSEFGSRFLGGMFFKGEVLAQFEDCKTTVDPTPANYKNFVENAAVVISTNGFGDSIPWKLMEYLKWGQCIVSEKHKHDFRVSPSDKVMMEFSDIQSCIKQCEVLLNDEDQRSLMKQNAKSFYQDHLSPEAAAKAIITDALTDA